MRGGRSRVHPTAQENREEYERDVEQHGPREQLHELVRSMRNSTVGYVAFTYSVCAFLALFAFLQQALIAASIGACLIAALLTASTIGWVHDKINDKRLVAELVGLGADERRIQGTYKQIMGITPFNTRVVFVHNAVCIFVIYSTLCGVIYLVSLKAIWAGWLAFGASLGSVSYFTYLFYEHDANTLKSENEIEVLGEYLSQKPQLLKNA